MPSIADLFDQAVRHHQAGALAVAETLYRQVVQADPHHANAWHHLALIARQAGQPKQAVEYLGQALRFNPADADAQNNLGGILFELGKLAEAADCFRQALRLQPDFAEAAYNLGNVLRATGHLEQAETCYREALRLNPAIAPAHNNLGIVLRLQGKLAAAEGCCREALRLQPGHAAAYNSLGNVLREQGKLEEAEACFRQAVWLNAGYADAHNNLAIVLQELGRLKEAESCCREALRLRPGFVEAHINLGNVLCDQGKLAEAEASLRQALRLAPDSADAHRNLANVLGDRDQLEEAEACCRQALRLRPDFVAAHFNLGNILGNQAEWQAAEACYRQAIRLKPDFADAHLNLGLLLLLQGKFAEGWPEYEWRRQTRANLPYGLEPPTWDGSVLDGRTILLRTEQGQGDAFQFIRYARLVKERGGRVVLHCPPVLAGILAGCAGIDQLVTEAPLPHHHVMAPLLSLPMLLGTTLQTIPNEVPYLAADPARVEHWRERLADLPGFKVGICWQGNPRLVHDRQRSVPLSHFAPVAAVPEVTLIALQRGHGLDQLPQNEHLRIVDLPGRSDDPTEGWLDTAALIQALDLIISADTGIVHLAGALGAPVWVALSFKPDWRWLLDREDSPWYPGMRLFRQRQGQDWTEVFQRIAIELRRRVAAVTPG